MSDQKKLAASNERIAWEGSGIYRWYPERKIWLKANEREMSEYISNPTGRTGTYKMITAIDLK